MEKLRQRNVLIRMYTAFPSQTIYFFRRPHLHTEPS